MRRCVALVITMFALACGGSPAPEPRNEGERDTAAQDESSGAESETVRADGAQEAERSTGEARTAPIVPPHGPLSEEDLHHGVLARLRDPSFSSCTVSALSPALRRRTTAPTDVAALRERVSMPIPESSVTAARTGDREAVIYTSSRLDPRSEIGDLGYRIRISGGGDDEDLALGLSALRPFVLVHNPMIALLEDDAVIQIEAELRALDDASIDFQPAEGLSTTRDGRERLLRCALDDLRRDQDGDGLTDLAEERLLTDAWDPDTDGDGTRDGDDRSPLGSAAPSTPADALWVAAYRELVAPEASEGLLVVSRSGPRLHVEGDPTTEGRVLVLREDELGAYTRRFGLRAPLVIAVGMRGEQRAEIVVDSVWSQRTYDARRDAAGSWTFTARTSGSARRE